MTNQVLDILLALLNSRSLLIKSLILVRDSSFLLSNGGFPFLMLSKGET